MKRINIGEVTAGKLLGLLKDLKDKMSGKDPIISWSGLMRFINLSKDQQKLFEQGRNPFVHQTFKVWKTIKIGTGLSTAEGFTDAIHKLGAKVSDWANDIMKQKAFTVAKEETEINLVKVTVKELGFKEGATYEDICNRAKELGLELCPAEVAPQLRLQYTDQPKGEWLRIAMEPIVGSGGYSNVFEVAHDDDDLWLNWNVGTSDYFWHSDNCFVFCLV
ncbi:MAG: hypothetical protein OEX08_00860 [Candidatus Nomurabacteria bacterium]|nr:hypothetical protein [Candidatus Nomurabacteria bacterium]